MTTTILISAIVTLLIVLVLLLRVKAYFIFTKKHSIPYFLVTENKSNEKSKAILFGKNHHLFSGNYGSDNSIQITTVRDDLKYLHILMEAAERPFEIRELALKGKKEDFKNEVISLCTSDANGQMCEIPIVLGVYFDKDHFKDEDEITIRLRDNYKIDANTYLTYFLKPNAKVQWMFFYNTKSYYKTSLFRYLFYKRIPAYSRHDNNFNCS